MNIFKPAAIAAVVLFFVFAFQSWAVEGLQLSVQCSNVVLTWPTVDGSGDTYLIRRRPDLSTNSTWTVVADGYSAASGTNLTAYIDYGVVTNASCDGGGEMMSMARRGFAATTTTGDMSDVSTNLPPMPPGFESVTNGDGSITTMMNPSRLGGGHFTADDDGPPGGFGGTGEDDTPTAPVQAAFYEVVKDGVTLYGLTNGMTVSGFLKLPVEVAGYSGTLSTLTLQDSGDTIASSIHVAPFELPVPFVTLDTRLMSNGIHDITLYAQLTDTGDGTEESGATYEYTSTDYSITVLNEISYPDYSTEFGETGNSLEINALSAHSNVDWFIDVYGQTTNYIGTLGGSTTNGVIDFVWNLIGPGNTLLTDSQFEFVITTVYGDPVTNHQSVPPTYHTTDRWAASGDWVVVNQQAWNNLTSHEDLDTMTDGFASYFQGIGLGVHPTPNEGKAYRIRFGSGDPNGDSDWANFRTALYNPLSRNLYYLGHGTPNGLGAKETNATRFISTTEIATQLATIPAGLTNKHKFRFAFVDGCSSANGTLPESFGIKHKANVLPVTYGNESIRPSAFVGWNDDKAAGFIGSVNESHVDFVQYFLEFWSLGNNLKSSLDIASAEPQTSLLHYSNLKVFGDWQLNVNAFNQP